MSKPKKVFVTGFPHTGTTIVAAKLGECVGVHREIEETLLPNEIPSEDTKIHLWKFPALPDLIKLEGFPKKDEAGYEDTHIIFMIRNPYFVFSSLTRRNINPFKFPNHTISEYILAARRFIECRYQNYPMVYPLMYETMFDNNFEELRNIMDEIGFEYDDNIFTQKSQDYLTQNVSKVPKKQPKENFENHEKFRTWQINQEFKNMNDISKIYLHPSVKEVFDNSETCKRLHYLDPREFKSTNI